MKVVHDQQYGGNQRYSYTIADDPNSACGDSIVNFVAIHRGKSREDKTAICSFMATNAETAECGTPARRLSKKMPTKMPPLAQDTCAPEGIRSDQSFQDALSSQAHKHTIRRSLRKKGVGAALQAFKL